MSKSAASRHWIAATAAKVTELRERDLRGVEFFGLMLDGVALIFGSRQKTHWLRAWDTMSTASACVA